MIWNDNKVAELTSLRATGLTCVQIALRMKMTKGMIAGKLYRIGKRLPMSRADRAAIRRFKAIASKYGFIVTRS